MRPTIIRHLATKEILSTLRDRRALISNLLIPLLLLPIIMLGLPLALGGLFQREQATTTELAVKGLDFLPEALKDALEAEQVTLNKTDNPQLAVQDGDAQVALEVPEDTLEAVRSGRPTTLTLYSKTGNLRSELNASKVGDAVARFEKELVTERLREAGLDEDVLEPLRLETRDASTEAERSSGQLAWLIPFFIAVWTLTGGQMTAIDATAGEKERGTLEALLVSPARRAEVVVGKWLATLTFGLSAALMAILGYLLGGTVLKRVFSTQLGDDASAIVELMGGSLQVSPLSTLLLMISALLLAAFIASALISITMFARSFKEAQSYVAPLSFLLIIPAIGLQFADFFSTSAVLYLIPMLNALILMDDVVKGNTQLLPVLLTWGSLAGFTILLLDLAYRSFKREGVIFRT